MTKGIRKFVLVLGLGCLLANVCGLFFSLHILCQECGHSEHHDSQHCEYCQNTFLHSKPALEAVYDTDTCILGVIGQVDLFEDRHVRVSGFSSKIERGPPARI